jgi:hypothetical protein
VHNLIDLSFTKQSHVFRFHITSARPQKTFQSTYTQRHGIDLH